MFLENVLALLSQQEGCKATFHFLVQAGEGFSLNRYEMLFAVGRSAGSVA